jgi:hypothetical protein
MAGSSSSPLVAERGGCVGGGLVRAAAAARVSTCEHPPVHEHLRLVRRRERAGAAASCCPSLGASVRGPRQAAYRREERRRAVA